MTLNALLFAAVTLFSLPAFSADKHDDAHAKHGGVAVEAGTYHVELVAKEKSLTFYVYDHNDKPMDVKGAKATANVFSGKDKGAAPLAASGGNIMKGETPFTIGSDAKIIVSFTFPGKKSEQARFALGAKQELKGHKH
ncbi:MAG TPA: hypothetical protein VK642_14130 [Burkholderiales bacterium]|nr:hypothetical protein [Burkholderiales bacterium]